MKLKISLEGNLEGEQKKRSNNKFLTGLQEVSNMISIFRQVSVDDTLSVKPALSTKFNKNKRLQIALCAKVKIKECSHMKEMIRIWRSGVLFIEWP